MKLSELMDPNCTILKYGDILVMQFPEEADMEAKRALVESMKQFCERSGIMACVVDGNIEMKLIRAEG